LIYGSFRCDRSPESGPAANLPKDEGEQDAGDDPIMGTRRVCKLVSDLLGPEQGDDTIPLQSFPSFSHTLARYFFLHVFPLHREKKFPNLISSMPSTSLAFAFIFE
jgi:hypothetical protein